MILGSGESTRPLAVSQRRRDQIMITSDVPRLDSAQSILYLAALLGDRPRRIDHYIDYFGSTTIFRNTTAFVGRSDNT